MNATRILLVLVCCWFATLATAAGLGGTYAIDGQQGRIVAKLEEKGARLTGSIDFGGQTRINLVGAITGNTARGSATSKDGAGQFEAQVDGDKLSIVISQKDGPNQKAARLPLLFQRTGTQVARHGIGDPRLIGHWSSQNLIVSGNASFASEEHLIFREDGSYVYSKGAAAGGAVDWSFDGGQGTDREHGLWRTQEGMLFVQGQNGQWVRIATYGMTGDGSTMRITYDGGGKKLWSRQTKPR
jgi:hypothetical protein